MTVRRRLLVATHSAHKLRELRQLLHLPNSTLVSLDDVGIPDDAIEDGDTFDANAIAKARFYAELSGLPTLADDSGIEVDALDGRPGVRSHRYAHEQASDEENNAELLRELAGLPPERRSARYRCSLALAEQAGGAVAPHATPRSGAAPTRLSGAGPSATSGAAPSAISGAVPSATSGAAPSATSSSPPSSSVSSRAVPLRITIRRGTFEGRIAQVPRGSGGFGYDPLFEPAGEPVGGRTVGLFTAAEKNRVSHRARAARAMRRVLVARGY